MDVLGNYGPSGAKALYFCMFKHAENKEGVKTSKVILENMGVKSKYVDPQMIVDRSGCFNVL